MTFRVETIGQRAEILPRTGIETRRDVRAHGARKTADEFRVQRQPSAVLDRRGPVQARQPADEVGFAFVRKAGKVAPLVRDDERPLERQEIAGDERLEKKRIGHPGHRGGSEVPVEQRAPGPARDRGRGHARVARGGRKRVRKRRVHIVPSGSVRGVVQGVDV